MNQKWEDDAAALRFVERMGQLMESNGFTRTAGRIFGLLLLSPDALSLEELSESLQSSSGSVSQETRSLEKLGAIERVTRPGSRRVYYEAADRMHERMLALHMERFEYTREALRDGMKSAAAQDDRVRSRMECFESFFRVMVESIRNARDEWQQEQEKA